MITVAHLDHTVEPGGAELALARLINSAPGWRPRLFVPPSKGDSRGAFSGVPSDNISIRGVQQPAGALASGFTGQLSHVVRVVLQASILRASRQFRLSNVVHGNTSRAAVIGWLACIGSRRKLVVHLRDAIDEDALGRRSAKLLSFTVSRAAGIVANSEYTFRTAAPYLRPRTHAQVIPSQIGLAEPRPPAPIKENIDTIGMLARITEWKGQELLLRAFADEFGGSSITLELAGSPAFGQQDYMVYLQGLAHELGIDSQVRFLGHVSNIWPLLDNWDICVHASLHSEPLGQNVLQYLAACRPTVAARAGGPTEWVQHARTGLLFEPRNQLELQAALRQLAGDYSLRRDLSERLASERPVPTDWEVLAMYERFFAAVASGGRTGPSQVTTLKQCVQEDLT